MLGPEWPIIYKVKVNADVVSAKSVQCLDKPVFTLSLSNLPW